MPDTVILADETLEALHDSFHSGVERIVMQTFELQREVSREYEIRCSPLEKFLRRRVKILGHGWHRIGTLTDFGPGWIEIAADELPVVIYTGAGTCVQPESNGEK